MSNLIDLTKVLENNHANQPHYTREAICLACMSRFMLVHACKVWMKDLICDCGVKGKIIGTGQELEI